MSQRPSTATSTVTIESAASAPTAAATAATATAPLAAKKGRATASVQKDTTKPPRAKKAVAGAAKNGPKSTGPARPKTSSGAASVEAEGDALDNLTSGIKKITLVTKQQKQARTRENKKPVGGKKAASSAGSKTPSLPVTPGEELQKELGGPSNGHSGPVKGVPRIRKDVFESETGQTTTPTVDVTAAEAKAVKVENPSQTPPLKQPEGPDVFVEYQPEGPTPEIITPQGPLEWLPLNTIETPSSFKQPEPPAAAATTPDPLPEEAARDVVSPSPMKRDEVPVFTATSQLRFAPRAGEQQERLATPLPKKTVAGRVFDRGVWEVPESPDHLA